MEYVESVRVHEIHLLAPGRVLGVAKDNLLRTYTQVTHLPHQYTQSVTGTRVDLMRRVLEFSTIRSSLEAPMMLPLVHLRLLSSLLHFITKLLQWLMDHTEMDVRSWVHTTKCCLPTEWLHISVMLVRKESF